MTPKILVKPTSIEVVDYELGENVKLERNFTIYDPLYHTQYYKGIGYDAENNVLYLPRGLDINYVERAINTTATMVVKPSSYAENNTEIMMKYLPRDEKQKEALKFLLGSEKYTNTASKSQLKVNLSTGVGKTYITVAYIACMNIKTIIIANTINLLDQWRARITEYTDITDDEIFTASGSAMLARLFHKKDVGKYKIILVSHDTLKSYGDNNGWDKITELFKYLKIGIKVYDEAHFNFDNMMNIDFHTSVYKNIYLTATPNRSNEAEDRIYQLAFKNVPAIDLFEDEDCKTKYISIHFNSHPSLAVTQRCKNQYGFNRIEYIKYVVETPEFYNLVDVLIPMMRSTPGKVLIYIGLNESILKVYEYILENYPEFVNNIGIFTSINDDKEDALDNKIILSTTKSAGTGIDIKGLTLTIVLAEPFKSKVLARQTLGRTRQTDTTYIDIVDDGFYATKRYFSEKKPIFRQYATEFVDIRTSQADIDMKANNARNAYRKEMLSKMERPFLENPFM